MFSTTCMVQTNTNQYYKEHNFGHRHQFIIALLKIRVPLKGSSRLPIGDRCATRAILVP